MNSCISTTEVKTIKLYVLDIGGVTVERDWERHQAISRRKESKHCVDFTLNPMHYLVSFQTTTHSVSNSIGFVAVQTNVLHVL